MKCDNNSNKVSPEGKQIKNPHFLNKTMFKCLKFNCGKYFSGFPSIFTIKYVRYLNEIMCLAFSYKLIVNNTRYGTEGQEKHNYLKTVFKND